MRCIEITEHDRCIYEQEIRPFLPERMVDVHTHLIANHLHPRLHETMPLACEPLLGEVDCAFLQRWWKTLFPDTNVIGMVMGFPTAGVDIAAENAYVAQEAKAAGYPFALMTHPKTPATELNAEIELLKPSVLKPYMVFSGLEDPNQASITDMIPEAQLALANEYQLAVMLHVAKPQGMAEPENLAAITRLINDFPQCHFILAHCGRCFIAPNMEKALNDLPVAENLWVDTSAVCDLGVFVELLQRYDRSRILFGTDLVTAVGFRGSYVRLGMSWHVCTAEMVARSGGMADKTTFAAYENLAALCRALQITGCTSSEQEALFYSNACRLFDYSRNAI